MTSIASNHGKDCEDLSSIKKYEVDRGKKHFIAESVDVSISVANFTASISVVYKTLK